MHYSTPDQAESNGPVPGETLAGNYMGVTRTVSPFCAVSDTNVAMPDLLPPPGCHGANDLAVVTDDVDATVALPTDLV